jgi:asparagine synthase (glutamine-hydrolysing)
MCGIAGVLSKTGEPVAPALLESMGEQIAHRGPDGHGAWASGPIGLAHRRLAIIDLTGGANQPMHSQPGGVSLVFNGEIYNFKELRAQLEAKGFTFRTKSDTEVIIAAWQAWGTAAVARLDGMFAFALWDATEQTLLLARDRTGKKPLFVYEDSGRLVFGSEIKAILAHPGLDRSMNPEAVPQFLSHGYVPTPHTFYSRIRKLEPATWELHRLRGESRVGRYWEFPVGPERPVVGRRAIDDAARQVRALFFEAVRKRLVSDVPLGAFLSGGIDSSLVVAAMAAVSGGPIKTFCIGFEGPAEWDETAYAALVAKRYGTEHTEFKVKPESFDLVEKLAWHYDEPFGDSSAIPTFIVSSLTRTKVTVALTGDGGDELFAGYTRFGAATGADFIPRPLRQVAGAALSRLPHASSYKSNLERVRRFGEQAARDLPDRLRGWTSFFSGEELQGLLGPELRRHVTDEVLGRRYRQQFDRARAARTLNQVLFVNARTYLLDDLNVKMDRASMAASLEARAPFLDTDLMDFVFTLPGSLKWRGLQTKWLLRRAMGDLLPPEILSRSKMGFGVPLGAWFRGSLKRQLDERLLEPASPLHEYVSAEGLRRLVETHHSGRRDLGHQLWCLWMLDIWLRRERSADRVGQVRA